MIEFGKITGEIEDGLVQVKMRTGECLFAPLTIVGNGVTVPSDDWIKSNKDSFLALVTYEKDLLQSPIIIGFYPLKSYSTENSGLYKTLSLIKEILDILKEAKTLTLMGPQTFTPDTIMKLTNLDSIYNNILKDIRL